MRKKTKDSMPGLREAILEALQHQFSANWRNVMRPYGPVSVKRSQRGSSLLLHYHGIEFEVQVRQKKWGRE